MSPGTEERFQRPLRNALNTPPKHRSAPKINDRSASKWVNFASRKTALSNHCQLKSLRSATRQRDLPTPARVRVHHVAPRVGQQSSALSESLVYQPLPHYKRASGGAAMA